MAIYLINFEYFPGFVKVGMSTDTMRRVRDHINDNGRLTFLEEFSTPEGVKDKATERMLLDEFRPRLSEWETVAPCVKGWTEFVPAVKLEEMRMKLLALGYTKTALTADAFKDVRAGHPFQSKANELEKAIKYLQIADAVILTVLQAGRRWPSTVEEFNEICESVGTETGWCGPEDFYFATHFHNKWPEGVIHQTFNQIYNIEEGE